MKLSDLSDSQMEFLAVLEAFSHSVPSKVVSHLVPLSPEDMNEFINTLAEIGWLHQTDNNEIRLTKEIPTAVIGAIRKTNTKIRLRELLDQVTNLNLDNHISPNILIDLFHHAGKPKKAAFLAYDCALKEIESGNYERALIYCLTTVTKLKNLSGDSECDRLFISASLTLSELFPYGREVGEEILEVLWQAREVSERLGDKRNLALVTLNMGRTYHLLHKLEDALRSLTSGLDMIRKLGDEDIMAQAAGFYGMYYHIQGMSKEVLEHLEHSDVTRVFQKGKLSNLIFCIYSGNSAAFMGRFYHAIGVLDSGWRRARLNSEYLGARLLRACLGCVLLMAGKPLEAFSHLKETEKEALAQNDIWSQVWTQRGLAYYHFLEGHIQESYNFLKECLSKAARSGMPRPFYAFPWVLEMLFGYHLQGYEPIPEYDFEREMEIAINGINIHLRGTALRIRAKQAEIRGDDSTVIEKLLRKSEADQEKVADPIELAKTRAQIARLKLREGIEKEALDLALLAWEGLSAYGEIYFPKELKSLLQRKGALPKGEIRADDTLTRYMEMIDDFIPSADPDELLFRLAAATSKFFEAERGAIFWRNDNDKGRSLFLRTAFHMDREEAEGEQFRSQMRYVLKAYKTNQPIVARLPQSAHGIRSGHTMSILCLPYEIRNEVRGVLYHDSTYSDSGFESFEKALLKRIAQNVGNYVMRINEYCRQMEERSRIALRQTTYDEEYNELEIKAQSRTMRGLLERVDRAAKTDAPILIFGETGAGKELFARRLHAMSPRHTMPFIAVNLSTIPETLVESELFGHEKGAFTGADSQKPGRMELANKGTLFFDEIGDIPKSVQVKILRALEEKTFFRVGGTRNLTSDFRLVAATNRDMVKEVETGNFREDLFYRLSVVPLIVPPLRKRGDDVVVLARHFLAQYAKKYNQPVPELTAEDKAMLKAYHWPGNVRELKNVIERAMVLSNGEKLELTIPRAPRKPSDVSTSFDNPFSDKPTMDELQRRYINYILNETSGKLSGPGGASAILGMKRTTLYTRMKKLDLA